jgi:hypothetical protein
MTTTPALLALEVWRASGARTKDRLLDLVEHWCNTLAEQDYITHHEQSALDAVRPWEWPEETP